MKIKADEKLFKEARSCCNELKVYCTNFADFFGSIMQNDMIFSKKDLDEFNLKFEKAKKELKLKMKKTYDTIDEIKKKIDKHINEGN